MRMSKEELLKSMQNTNFVSRIDEPAPVEPERDFSFIERVWVNTTGGITASWHNKEGRYIAQTWKRRFHVDREYHTNFDSWSDSMVGSLEMERPYYLAGTDVSELIADAKRRGIFEK